MIPREFDYHAPKSIPDALGLLKQFGDEAKLLAGGHSLLPMMKMRFAQPGHLIDIGRIPELKGIREAAGTLHIGAMTTENELIWSKLLQDKCPLLIEGARLISDPQVRCLLYTSPSPRDRSVSRMPLSSRILPRSIKCPGWAKRIFIIGSRLWPPASNLASSPNCLSKPSASGMVLGA